VLDLPSTLLRRAAYLFVHDEVSTPQAQIGAQAALIGIEGFRVRAPAFREKTLREILSVRCSAIPAQAHIFVNGLPVRLAQCVLRSLALRPILNANACDDRPSRGREALISAVIRVQP